LEEYVTLSGYLQNMGGSVTRRRGDLILAPRRWKEDVRQRNAWKIANVAESGAA